MNIWQLISAGLAIVLAKEIQEHEKTQLAADRRAQRLFDEDEKRKARTKRRLKNRQRKKSK